MNRCFYCECIPEPGDSVVLSPEESRHAGKVLRVRKDDTVALLDGNGTLATGRIASEESTSRPRSISCEIVSKKAINRSDLEISLYVAPPRQKSMSLIIKQAVELGVSEITPINTQHTIPQPRGDYLSGWHRDALEACKQARNPFLPILHSVTPFNTALETLDRPGIFGAAPRSWASPNSDQSTLPIKKAPMFHGKIAVWVGPEGGFTDDEMEEMTAKRLVATQVGRWTLRIETAAVALLTVVTSIPAADD